MADTDIGQHIFIQVVGDQLIKLDACLVLAAGRSPRAARSVKGHDEPVWAPPGKAPAPPTPALDTAVDPGLSRCRRGRDDGRRQS